MLVVRISGNFKYEAIKTMHLQIDFMIIRNAIDENRVSFTHFKNRHKHQFSIYFVRLV